MGMGGGLRRASWQRVAAHEGMTVIILTRRRRLSARINENAKSLFAPQLSEHLLVNAEDDLARLSRQDEKPLFGFHTAALRFIVFHCLRFFLFKLAGGVQVNSHVITTEKLRFVLRTDRMHQF